VPPTGVVGTPLGHDWLVKKTALGIVDPENWTAG
jgi:hypothetical protein